MVRCCDLAGLSHSSQEGAAVLPNPYSEPSLNQTYIMPVQPAVADLLFNR